MITRVRWLALLIGGLFGAGGALLPADGGPAERDWQAWDVPGTRQAPADGLAWCRAFVKVPDTWTAPNGLLAESVTLTLENVVDACIVYVNGLRIGQCGSFPPDGRTARDEVNRFKVPPGTLRAGQYNTIALQLAAHDRILGFQGRAPVLAGYHDECVLSGEWQYRAGEHPPDSLLAVTDRPAAAVFDRVAPASSALARPSRLTPGRHLSPSAALAAISTSSDLAVDLLLSEPLIAQPLSLDFDERGRLWVVEYRQYPYPAGLNMVSRDKFYRAAYDRQPAAPPHHTPGADRVSIHTDSDGDGQFDKHAVFLDELNIVSSIEPGAGGIWVLNPPYLLFFADRDGNDRPDGDPEIHLEGFGLEDTHSIANSLTWGPDGWLYGAQGSTTSSRVQVVGTDQPAVYRDGAMIWRYHPGTRRYEIFAEGGGNAFGLEIDARGHIFSGHNGANTRGFHYVQGGFFEKGSGDKYGPLSNPFVFNPLPFMAHGQVPRFSHDLVRYEGVGLPAKYGGKLFSIDPLQQQVMLVEITEAGSTFATRDLTAVLSTKDPAFRPVDITVGPDGAVYVADFCEEFIAHGQHFQGQIDPATGRVYRLRSARAADHARRPELDLTRQTPQQWVEQLRCDDRWRRRMALRLLTQRGDKSVVPSLRQMLRGTHPQAALEALWALHGLESLTPHDIEHGLRHSSRDVRRCTVQLVGDDPSGASTHRLTLTRLAVDELDAQVCAQLACTAQRLPAQLAMVVVASLLTHDAHAEDAYLPQLIWWAVESKADDHAAVLELLGDRALWQRPLVRRGLLASLMRRYANGDRTDLMACAELLDRAVDDETRRALLAGFEQAFVGRSAQDLPERLVEVLEAAGGGSLAFRVRRGEAAAIEQAIAVLVNDTADPTTRAEYARLLAETGVPDARDALLTIVRRSPHHRLLAAVLSCLQSYEDPTVAPAVLERFDVWPADLRADAQRLLASRPSWAKVWLRAALERSELVRHVPPDAVARLRLHADADLQRQVAAIWPRDEGDPRIARSHAAELDRVSGALAGREASPYRGRSLFATHCAKCHRLFREGGEIGPDLTPYQRADSERMALQIVHPSLEIREGFETWTAITADGRVVNGFLLDQDANVIVLRGADGHNVTLQRNSLDELERTRLSLMPAGLLEPLSGQEIRDLFAFLRISQPLAERAP